MKITYVKKNYFLLLLLIFACFTSCEKEYRATGSKLVTCKVDGQTFKPNNFDWKGRSKPTYSEITNDTLSVKGIYSVQGKSETVTFRIENFSGIGIYTLSSPYIGSIVNYGGYYLNGVWSYTDANHTGRVVVTDYIPEKRIVAGTFYFTTIDPATGTIYKITDGRFDMPF